MAIKHKAVKVKGDRGFANEWNDRHLFEKDLIFQNTAQLIFNADYMGWSTFFTKFLKRVKYQVGQLICQSFWALNETSGTTATDYMGNSNGTFNLAPVWGTGKLGNCAACDGTQRMDTGYPYSDNTKPFTMMFWLKTNSTVTGMMLSNRDGTANVTGFDFYLSGGKLAFRVCWEVGSTSSIITTKNMADNMWHHVVMVKKANAASADLYVDNALIASFPKPGTIANGTYTMKFMSRGDNDEKLIGSIDNIKYYYNYEADADDIAFDWAWGKGRQFDLMSFPTAATETDEEIISAILIVNATLDEDATMACYLSANDGVTWEEVQPNEEHFFEYTGEKLKVNISITGDGEVNEYACFWNI